MNNDQISLLLYLETRAVDYDGKVAMEKMNKEDLEQAKAWNESKFIGFGRICLKDIDKRQLSSSSWIELSEEAWTMAHTQRKLRADRGMASRSWRKTSEKN